jgi:hypothetical protein
VLPFALLLLLAWGWAVLVGLSDYLSVSFLLWYVVSSVLVSRVVVGSCAWSPLYVDIAGAACRLPEVSDMSMRGEKYHGREKELRDLLSSATLSFVVSYVFVFVFSRTAPFACSQSVMLSSRDEGRSDGLTDLRALPVPRFATTAALSI